MVSSDGKLTRAENLTVNHLSQKRVVENEFLGWKVVMSLFFDEEMRCVAGDGFALDELPNFGNFVPSHEAALEVTSTYRLA